MLFKRPHDALACKQCVLIPVHGSNGLFSSAIEFTPDNKKKKKTASRPLSAQYSALKTLKIGHWQVQNMIYFLIEKFI